MTTIELARLEAVDPKEYWKHEAADFTPWLAEGENLKLLGDTIGLELELEAREKGVGPFRADLLCKSTVDASWVLIENQLERTDHSHLGQLLTYAAGLQAVTVVWIARTMTDEHRAALDWLNEITDTRINFFGLEIQLWKIGTSPVAPKFNVVSKPNDWTKPPRVELTETQRTQWEYWQAFRDHVAERGAGFSTTKPQPQNWMDVAIGKTGYWLRVIASTWNSHDNTFDTGEIRAEFVALNDTPDSYAKFRARRDKIEKRLGLAEELKWDNPENTKSWRTYLRKTADVSDRADWLEQHEWLRARLDSLHRVFQPLVKDVTR